MDDRQKLTLVVFNLTVVAFMIYRYLTIRMDMTDFLLSALIGIGIGLVTGAIAYFITGRGR